MAEESDKLNVESQVIGTSDQMLFCFETTFDSVDSQFDVPPVQLVSLHAKEAGQSKPDFTRAGKSHASWQAAMLSTLTSLAIVLILLTAVRFLLPPMLESARYGWYRGQLRAEHEVSGEHLQNVSLEGLSKISESVTKYVTPSVVHIDVRQKQSDLAQSKLSLQSLLDRENLVVQGSGVIVDADGYILTNQHVLENSDAVDVVLSDRRRLRAQVVGSDVMTDLALLKIDADGLIPIQWGDSEQLKVGSFVWAVGSPFGLSGSITFGIISSKHRINLRDTPYAEAKVKLRPHYGDLLQSDVAVNPGNSGGPLVDAQGKLVGINTAILGETYRGVSFSIPSRVAKRCYEQIRSNGKVERGWLGVELAKSSTLDSILSEVSTAEDLDRAQTARPLGGAVIQGFAHGNRSPGLLAGLRIGDRIVEFNGTQIYGSDELIGRLGEMDAGAAIPIRVMRGKQFIDLTVTLGKRPLEDVR